MPYSEPVANAVRALLIDQTGVTEQRMFGCLAFMVQGHLAIAVGSGGDDAMMLRLGDEKARLATEQFGATPTIMRGRAMKGWVDLSEAVIADERDLARWVQLSLDFVRTLPAKQQA